MDKPEGMTLESGVMGALYRRKLTELAQQFEYRRMDIGLNKAVDNEVAMTAASEDCKKLIKQYQAVEAEYEALQQKGAGSSNGANDVA